MQSVHRGLRHLGQRAKAHEQRRTTTRQTTSPWVHALTGSEEALGDPSKHVDCVEGYEGSEGGFCICYYEREKSGYKVRWAIAQHPQPPSFGKTTHPLPLVAYRFRQVMPLHSRPQKKLIDHIPGVGMHHLGTRHNIVRQVGGITRNAREPTRPPGI